MKRILLTIALGLGLLTANAQIEKLAGPRVGFTLVSAGPIADFIHDGFDFDEDEDGGYGSTGPAFTTLYGWQWESRFADGGGNITGIVEWIVLVGGMERGKFLPSASSIIGARTDKGLEFGIGPNLSLSGVGMVFGVGYNFKSGRLNLPVNISIIPGRKMTGEIENWGPPSSEPSSNDQNVYTYEEYEYNTGTRIAITLGFNMSK